jgi:UDP-N-acetylmuramate dehydrogenase
MKISENVPLSRYSTMGLGGPARFLSEITTGEELTEALSWARERNLPVLMIGGGSNTFWSDDGFPGLVLVNRIMGFDVAETGAGAEVTIAAGEVWDSAVERCVEAGLTGIEALSLIPGSTGGTPVQNVGAYGQEISETLVHVEAYDTKAGKFVTIPGAECGFSYRDSRFKTGPDRGRFLITGIKLRLRKGNPEPPFYASVRKYFEEHGVQEYTPDALRQAVIAIRTAKLPDPAKVRNNGSFFANPIVSEDKFLELRDKYPGVPNWDSGGRIKLSAAWLIEQAGFKDFHDKETGISTWPRQPLVLVNEHARSTADLLAFKNKIVVAVQDKFGVTLVQEPELLP